MCSKTLGKPQWEWIAQARAVARMRPSTAAAEARLDGLLSTADQAMVTAFTGGFRAAQAKIAISKVLAANIAETALESAQITALAILVREVMLPDLFAAIYRPFATILPGPGAQPLPPSDRQVDVFVERMKGLAGPAKDEVVAVGKALSEPAGKPVIPTIADGQAPAIAAPPAPISTIEVASMYGNAWKASVSVAAQSGLTPVFRAAQTSAENVAPHDGTGLVSIAGVAAGGLSLRDVLPIETVLLLYEPFAAAFPFETLR